MSVGTDLVRRTSLVLRPDPARVIARPMVPGHEVPSPGISRAEAVMARILALSEDAVTAELAVTVRDFSHRHADLLATFREHFHLMSHRVPAGTVVSPERELLIGAFLTQEFAVESAALFNPSIVPHPDQEGLAPGELRFVMSVRAVGEGHVSSIGFRTGVVGPDDDVRVDEPLPRLSIGRVAPAAMSRESLRAALAERGQALLAEAVMRQLPTRFTWEHLDQVLSSSELDRGGIPGQDGLAGQIRQLAANSYDLVFPPERDLSERVIFPHSPAESHGLEDARFVRFVGEDGAVTHYATYTAYDGMRVAPQLIQTDDFTTFSVRQQIGLAAKDKGMALFPRRINGEFWAMSRWDGQNLSVATSQDATEWGPPVEVQRPSHVWDLIQLGVCASPLETRSGWLVLTHGVGPVRTYGMGALLLDLGDPTHVLGVLDEPLLTAQADEREGYVPNVVYSCGAMVHGDSVVLPYGCSDSSIRFAFVDLEGLLARLLASRAVPGG